MATLSSLLSRIAILAWAVMLCWFTVADVRVGDFVEPLANTKSDSETVQQTVHGQEKPPITSPPSPDPRFPDNSDHDNSAPLARLTANPQTGPSPDQPFGDGGPEFHAVEPPQHGPARIEELGRRLRQLGASYLLLERWQQLDGENYRFRCDVAGAAAPVNCCFDVTRPTAEAAMEEVLRTVAKLNPSAPTSHHPITAQTAPWYKPAGQ